MLFISVYIVYLYRSGNTHTVACSYQRSTAEQDHENDEGFKPVVFYNQVAGLSQKPPVFPPAMCDGNITALVFGHTFCMTSNNMTWYTWWLLPWTQCYMYQKTFNIVCARLRIPHTYSLLLLLTTKSDSKYYLPSVQQASGSRYSSTTSTTATSSTSGLMSIVLPSEELVSSSWDKQQGSIQLLNLFLNYRLSSELLNAQC